MVAYTVGSFWVSITAAMGMPKLEAGPQKSARGSCGQPACFSVHDNTGIVAKGHAMHMLACLGKTHGWSRSSPRPGSP